MNYRAGFVFFVVVEFIFLAAETKDPTGKKWVWRLGVEAETPSKWNYLFPPSFTLPEVMTEEEQPTSKKASFHPFIS